MGTAFSKIASALQTVGISLGDVSQVANVDELARLVTVACLNLKAGRRHGALDEDADDAGAQAIRRNLATDPDLHG